MKKGLVMLLIVLLGSMIYTNAQTYHSPQAGEIASLLQNQNCEVQIKFKVDSKDRVNYFSRRYSVDKVKMVSSSQYDVYAYLNNSDLQRIQQEQILFQIKTPDPTTKAFTMATTVAQMSTWDKYPTYAVYLQMMAQFQATYPTLCKIDTVMGSTPGGRKILVAKISKNVNLNEDEPEFLYSSSMHGDETTGAIFLLRLIDYLLANYPTNTRVANLVNNMEIYICPFANPDGTYKTSNNTIGTSPTSTRSNFNNIDLNRNYPDPWTGTNPDGNATQPETQAFMTFASAHSFVMGGNFHGGAELTNYPWDYYTTAQRAQPDANWWIYVCKEYVDTCKVAASNNGYFTELAYTGAYPGVTEGADWYSVTGGRQDYMNYFHHCRELTIEVSSTKTLGTENLNTYWGYDYKSLLQYMEQALYGIRGIVTDAQTGLPIKAKVFVNSHDADSTNVYTSLPIGNYHRPIKGGTYSVTYSAPCYLPQTFSITVGDKQSFRKDVQLVSGLEAKFVSSDTLTCNYAINFTNTTDSTSTGNIWQWNFGDGGTSTINSPSHTYTANGNYTVRLIATNSCGQKDTVIKTSYIHIQSPTVPTVVNGQSCLAAQVALSASATGIIRWYNLATGGNLIATGNSYTTPLISTTQTYYVENWVVADSITGGDSRVNSGGGFYNLGTEYGLFFDAIKPFKLLSVLVNANSSASRTIKLYNSAGTVIQQKTITLAVGQTRVYLNFDVPQGTGFKITANTNPNLYRNNVTASYPYLIGDLVKITGSNAATNPATVYYFFYDWSVQEYGCTSSRVPITASIGAGVAPSNAGTINGSATVCQNQTNVVFSVPTIANATSYLWTLPAGFSGTSSTNTISVSINSTALSGAITVKGVNDCGNGLASSKSITVNRIPQPTSIIGLNHVCPGQSNVTYYTPRWNYATSYEWIVPTGVTIVGLSNDTAIIVNFSSSVQSCNIAVKALNSCGTTDSISYNIIINPLPQPTTIIGPTQVCSGQNNVVFYTPSWNYATSYEWVIPAGVTIVGSSNDSSITLNFPNNAQPCSIGVKALNNCGITDSISKFISIGAVPNASYTYITSASNVTFTNTSSNGIDYLWNFDDGSTSTSQNPVHAFTQNGDYHVSLVVSNPCGSDSVNILITVAGVSISEIYETNFVSVYPIPADERIIVNIHSEINTKTAYKLYDNLGKLVFENEITLSVGDNKVPINISALSSGLYSLKFPIINKPIKVLIK
jgi:PKD repeat protein